MKRIALLLLVTALSGFAADELPLTLQSRTPVGAKQTAREQWLPQQTAIIVCDMWDLHHCKNAVTREGEMAPRMNEVLEKARGQGVLVVHAPSGCMKPYEGTPARERAKSAPPAARLPDQIGEWCKKIPAEELAVYPIDQTDGGEDDDPAEHAAWAKELAAKGLNPRAPWTREIDVLRIDQEKDAISDSGVEIWNLLEARGIRNVILMGVHVNMCVAGRPFGLRQMARNGKHVVLMRDLTDSMYNPARWPFVSHERGTGLFIEHIEKRICPTITSDQLIGGSSFAFSKATAGKPRLQVVLLGDSTTEASFPKKLAPDEPQVEDTLRILLAAESDLPPTDVYNEGVSGEYIRGLIDGGRYDKVSAKYPKIDYMFIRYGINDQSKRKEFTTNFPADFHELLSRLRKEHPEAVLIPMTAIPYSIESTHAEINALVAKVAEDEKLPFFDIAPRYLAELQKGPNMLNYRRYPLSKVPDRLKPFATPYLQPGADPTVVVLDNRLDALFGDLPGWYGDRHPNLAGYNVIADETAKFLAKLIRSKTAAPKLASP
ncbi:MAG TPA: GDSL-type esterase/lipase family protein [Chthoniobacteraceae bacterium]|jgi:lysophospholipase L1-like esterase/nicotinamidase-related amidase|nr:GDSL-type esterase/lipase family protein [Chthoniobacteraceae bacterium]